MKVRATTLPRNDASDTATPSCEVSVKVGAGPITGSRLSPASCACGAIRSTSRDSSARTTAMPLTLPLRGSLPLPACGERVGVRGAFTLMKTGLLRLQFAFELVQKAPIGAVGDDLLRARLDEVSFAHAQCVKTDRVLVVVLPPFVVRQFAEHLR